MVTDNIKKDVVFRRFNLIQPYFRFKRKFDIVFCRNVMIYFDQETKNSLTDRLYTNGLNPGGYLFIGHSETIPRDSTQFEYICPAVYRKKP